MRNGTQHPSRVQASKAQADVLAYAAKVKRSSSRLGLWEAQIFELVALGVSYRQVQTFLAERGTAVDVSALHCFVHAKKRAPLLAQVQGRLQQGAAPVVLAPSPKAKPPATPKAAPQKEPAPGLLPKFTWDPNRYSVEDLK